MSESRQLQLLPEQAPRQSRTRIRGLTWDHPRGYDCLADNVAEFHRLNPDLEIVWDRRSLQQFGAQPIEVLARAYDLLLIKHPFVDQAAAQGLSADLSGIIGRSHAERISRDSIGPSASCYQWGTGIYALPTDAAAQVAAYRPDLIEKLGQPLPRLCTAVTKQAIGSSARGR